MILLAAAADPSLRRSEEHLVALKTRTFLDVSSVAVHSLLRERLLDLLVHD
jgi:hypothetical protein